MLWIAARLGVDRKQLVLAACDCARLALAQMRDGEDRPRIAIETAESWTRGEATIAEVRAAAYAASAASAAAHAAAAAAAAHAADAYAYAYAGTAMLKKCAALVRKRIPWRVIAAALEMKNERP